MFCNACSSRLDRMSSLIFREKLFFVPCANPSELMRSAFAVCWVMVEPPCVCLRNTKVLKAARRVPFQSIPP